MDQTIVVTRLDPEGNLLGTLRARVVQVVGAWEVEVAIPTSQLVRRLFGVQEVQATATRYADAADWYLLEG
jgi:hypothetical protein